ATSVSSPDVPRATTRRRSWSAAPSPMRLRAAGAIQCRVETKTKAAYSSARSGTATRRVGEREELLARSLIGTEQTANRAGDCLGVLLLDAAHHHAEVIRFDDHPNALRLEHIVDRAGDLFG